MKWLWESDHRLRSYYGDNWCTFTYSTQKNCLNCTNNKQMFCFTTITCLHSERQSKCAKTKPHRHSTSSSSKAMAIDDKKLEIFSWIIFVFAYALDNLDFLHVWNRKKMRGLCAHCTDWCKFSTQIDWYYFVFGAFCLWKTRKKLNRVSFFMGMILV